MQKTGAELKKARLQQNLSLNEVSMATKINARVLEAMEENNSKKLPAKPFLRGFVKTYAEFLKLNSEDILVLFEEDLNPKPVVEEVKQEPPSEPKKQEKVVIKKPKVARPKKKKAAASNLKLPFLKEATITKQIFLIIFVILLIFMIIFIKGLVEKYQTEKQKALTSPVQEQLEPIKETPKVDEEVAPPTKQPEPIKKSDNTQSAVKRPELETEKTQPTPAEPKKAVEAKKEDPKPEPEPSSEEQQKQPSQSEKPAGEKPNASTVTAQEVILEAMDKVSIKATIDGKKEISINLEPGKVHVLKGEKIQVNFSDAGSVNVINNGKYLGVPGDLGQSKTVTYP